MTTLDLKSVTEYLYTTLVTAQKDRGERDDLIDGPNGLEFAWAAYERTCMHEAVNTLRAEHGAPPVPPEAVIRAELMAYGHYGYTREFAFRCAEIFANKDKEAS
ncbi:hypothetical protein ABT282_08720 [Streptomyces sp. NPDC000927]|uniref:hypothetical protein n=1 Tax=Streptomyces sp. NPDC000927 TaxID=3154371 RepID=UPI003330010C